MKDLTRFMQSLSRVHQTQASERNTLLAGSDVLLFSCSDKLKRTLSYPLVLPVLLPPQKQQQQQQQQKTKKKPLFLPYHKSFIDQACSVKFMAAFSFRSRPLQTQRKTWPVCIYLDLTVGLKQAIKTCYASNTMDNLTLPYNLTL